MMHCIQRQNIALFDECLNMHRRLYVERKVNLMLHNDLLNL